MRFRHDMPLLRALPRAEWYKAWRIIRKYDMGRHSDDPRRDESALGTRQRLYDHIDRKTVDGKISLNQSGMDCDCSKFTGGSIEFTTPRRKIERTIDQIYNDAEGPQSVWIDYPSRKQTNTSRDLALEAFEDGHPHVVYY